MRIHLLSGPIRSGKTTRLQAWAGGQAGAAGLLMPTDAHGRYFRDLRSGLQWPTAARPGDWQAQCLGPHRFSAAAFSWANHALLGAAAAAGTQWLLVDEVGPLELRGAGLAPALRRILHEPAYQPPHLLLVVRTGLREAVVEHFALHRWTLTEF
ncbi:hypothetical protein [Hymenobacter sp. B81]|uniref:hypothetical protein n=1 Tax=Hymenobacter sp. B81 TaxID=3344878 RepID=UPI0037DD1AA0